MNPFIRVATGLFILTLGAFLLPNAFASAPATHMAYLSVTSGSEFRFIECVTDACDQPNDILLSTDAIAAYAIVNGADQKGFIAYLGNHGAKKGLFSLKCTNGNCSQHTIEGLVAMTATIGELSVAMRGNGTPFITYFNANDHLLHAYACDDAACKSGKDRVLDTVVNNGVKSVVKISPDGNPAILYWGAVTPLHFLVCQDVDCANFTTTILSNAQYATEMDLEYGSDGLPVVAHDNLITGALKFTHCGNMTCSSGNTTKQLGVNATGARLAINRPGTPFVFYVQQASGGGGTHDMRATKCLNNTCTNPNWNTNMGTYVHPTLPSILLQPDGKPILIFSYTNGIDHDIEQWVCNDWQCSTHTTATVASIHSGMGFSAFNVKAAK